MDFVAPWHVGSSQIRDASLVSCVGRQFFTGEPLRKPTAMLVCFFWITALLSYSLPFKGFLNSSFVYIQGFPDGSSGKESACNERDLGLSPGLGRSPVEGNSYPLQYSGLENSMDWIVHGVTKSQTWLSDFHFHFVYIHRNIQPSSLSNCRIFAC